MSQIRPSLIPTLDEAVLSYESSGGCLTPLSLFGSDPLAGYEDLQRERQKCMEESIPSPNELFSYVVNGIDSPFSQSVQYMVEKSTQLIFLKTLTFIHSNN